MVGVIAPIEILLSELYCDERNEIRGCFIDPTNCEERIEDDTGRSVFSVIRFVV
jgi:hypothetical protein